MKSFAASLIAITVMAKSDNSDQTGHKESNAVNVIANAKTWLNPPVPYSQTAYHNGYRTDCSGYVSMAW